MPHELPQQSLLDHIFIDQILSKRNEVDSFLGWLVASIVIMPISGMNFLLNHLYLYNDDIVKHVQFFTEI